MAGNLERRLVFLGLGSNIQPEIHLPQAIVLLRQALEVEAISSVWETPAIGSPGPDFLNAALQARTGLPADELRESILRPIEERLGRVRTADPNAPRTIDIDILIYDGFPVEDGLWEQAHLSLPLSELIPAFSHPASGETMLAAAQRMLKSASIKKMDGLHFPDSN